MVGAACCGGACLSAALIASRSLRNALLPRIVNIVTSIHKITLNHRFNALLAGLRHVLFAGCHTLKPADLHFIV